jgi:tetratricopeptide (TPR) repeat protein
MERWQGFFFRALYLADACPGTQVRTPPERFDAHGHEAWLANAEPGLENGSILVSGLVPFVYYACEGCAFRLSGFEEPLDPGWMPVSELPASAYDPEAEPVRLWRWQGAVGAAPPQRSAIEVPRVEVAALFELGIGHFDAGEYPQARAHMAAIRERFPGSARSEDAAYFFSVTFWREQDCRAMLPAFEALLRETPASPWVAAAHYHIGMCLEMLGQNDAAREAFEQARQSARAGDPVAGYAGSALDKLRARAPLASLGRRLSRFVDGYRSAIDRALGFRP